MIEGGPSVARARAAPGGRRSRWPDASPARSGWLLVVLLAAVFMTTADNSIVNVAVPSIGDRLGATGGELELVVSGYILAYAALLVMCARLGMLYGYRRIFLLGLGTFTLASL